MYAIIEACGKQYKVAEGDVVFFEKLEAEEGKNFDKQLKAIKERYNEIIKGLGLKLSLEEQFETIKKTHFL